MSLSYEYQKWARDQPITGPTKSVLVVLSLFINDKGQCWPSYKTMSFETGLSIKTIQRSIQKLEKLGFLQIHRHQFKNSNSYLFPQSYPHRVRSHSPHLKKSEVKSRESEVTQSRETGQSDLLTTRNSHIESLLEKGGEEQKMNNGQERVSFHERYKTDPHVLRNLVRGLRGEKEGYHGEH